MSHSWMSGVNGDWNTASNWKNGLPTSDSTALITASGDYTVTSSRKNTVAILEMASGTTLAINAHEVNVLEGTGSGALAGTIEIGSATALVLGSFNQLQGATKQNPAGDGGNATYKNTGTIIIQSGGFLKVKDAVQINGGGKIVLAGHGRIEAYELTTSGSLGQLTNENTISGSGVIASGSTDPYLIFINAANGVIDGNGNGINEPLAITVAGAGFSNDGLLQASGPSGVLSLGEKIKNNGRIVSASAGAMVQLGSAEIDGGTISTVAGAVLQAQEGDNVINTTTPIANVGTIECSGGNLTITGSVNNSGVLTVGPGSVLRVDGEVTGGTATIYGSGKLELGGPSSVNVSFDPASNGILVLNSAEKYTGTIAGMDVNAAASINLIHILYTDQPTLNFDPANEILTITDTHVGRMRTINLSIIGAIGGSAGFTTKKAADGSLLIYAA
jgi:hypothetical protein